MEFVGYFIAQINAFLVLGHFAGEQLVHFFVRFAVLVAGFFLEAFFKGKVRQSVINAGINNFLDLGFVVSGLGGFKLVDEDDDATMLVIDNVDLLPDDLVTVETVVTPDKKAIKEAIESSQAAAAQITADGGEIPEELLNPVPGAHLEIGERSLQVR